MNIKKEYLNASNVIKLVLVVWMVIILLVPMRASADLPVRMYVSTNDNLVVSKNIEVDIYVDSDTTVVNAVQSIVDFDSNKLQYVSFNDTNSDFEIDNVPNVISSSSIDINRATFASDKSGVLFVGSIVFKIKAGGYTDIVVNNGSRLIEYSAPNSDILTQKDTLRITPAEPVYRFWSKLYQSHFYTNSNTEKTEVINNYSDDVWKYEKVGYYAHSALAAKEGNTPIYRFWSKTKKSHFYTANQSEKEHVIKAYSDDVWKYEKVAFYAQTYSGGCPADTSPVYRFWSKTQQSHFYTKSIVERNEVINKYSDDVWRYEGPKYCAW